MIYGFRSNLVLSQNNPRKPLIGRHEFGCAPEMQATTGLWVQMNPRTKFPNQRSFGVYDFISFLIVKSWSQVKEPKSRLATILRVNVPEKS